MLCSLPEIANILEKGGRGKREKVRKKRKERIRNILVSFSVVTVQVI
jgi:hypothetical protein